MFVRLNAVYVDALELVDAHLPENQAFTVMLAELARSERRVDIKLSID